MGTGKSDDASPAQPGAQRAEGERSNRSRFATRAIHAGQEPDPATGAVITPVYQTVTFAHDAVDRNKGWAYSRSGNPTRAALEECLASLEGGRFGLAYASGMAAIAGVMQAVSAGDHVVVADDLYGGAYRLFTQVLPRYGLRFAFVDATKPEEVAKAVTPETRMVWIESPTNPMLRIVDVAACAEIARRAGALCVVDNTFATPYLQNPLALGAHVSLHSTTKYVGGHSDVIGGAIVLDDEDLHARLKFTQNATGGVPGPWDAWLTLRGVKTLALRMREHCASAERVARFLRGRAGVAAVHWPGFEDHPGHALAKRQSRGFGGIVTVELAGAAAARRFSESLRLFALGESLGGVESLVGYPWLMSHAAFPPEEKRRKGITESVVRLSVGLEDADDLCADLEQALALAARA
jgi:cystathionine beta-lyase/cystathionine gamma-synthase